MRYKAIDHVVTIRSSRNRSILYEKRELTYDFYESKGEDDSPFCREETIVTSEWIGARILIACEWKERKSVYVCVCKREREREGESYTASIMCIYRYIYIYVYIRIYT